MKAQLKYMVPIAMAGLASMLTCVAGPTIIVTPPSVVVAPPTPPPVVVAPAPVEVVPDNYVWDGDEYVGVVGDQYYYLGPGNMWVAMDAPRLARFNVWARDHSDWREHAIRNEKYRGHDRDHGPEKEQPRHDDDHHDHDHDHNPPQ
jgi:hypothetical protein